MQQMSHDNENISDTASAKIEQKTEKETVKTENHNLPQIEAGVYSTIALKKMVLCYLQQFTNLKIIVDKIM